MSRKLKKIVSLAETALDGYTGSTSTIYLLEAAKRKIKDSCGRIGGKPIGITAETYPKFNGEPMEHLLTFDLRLTPLLQTGILEQIRAVSLFVSNSEDNEAYEPHTKESKVVLLSEEDVARGELENFAIVREFPVSTYKVLPVEVPEIIFTETLDLDKPFDKLSIEVFNASGYAGKTPLWLQDVEHTGEFILQFSVDFINTNLGDTGEMYVFADTAFWQCC
jgi:hypothetical protein